MIERVTKIVLASTSLHRGGVWRHIEDLGLGLQQAGLDVTVGLLGDANELQQAAQRAGLPWDALHRTVRTGDLWHIHLHDTYDRRAFLALAARRLAGPSVITEHLPRNHASDERLEPEHPRTRYAAEAKTIFKRLEFALAGTVIAVGASSARFLQERYAPPAGTVMTVHNGLDASAAPAEPGAPGEADHPLRIVAVGRLDRQKGIDVLLDAARLSSHPWEVTVVGSGPQLPRLLEIASDLPSGRVSFAGWVDDPRALVEAADVLCMPSRWESFPYAALEACSLARPVVASRVDGLDEIVLDGESGILVAPDRPGELAAALDGLAADRELVGAYGRAARARVRGLFTLPRMVDGAIAAYAHAGCRVA
jgi:glycosyltransferase involved in cell wall biosynthesis